MKNKKTAAWVRAAIAIVLAVVFLGATGFAFVDMLAGPDKVTEGAPVVPGAYVEADLSFIMDIVAVEKNGSGKEVAWYAVAPVGNAFTLLRFPVSDYDNMAALEEETRQFLQAESTTMDFHLIATGAVNAADDKSLGILAQWFTENVDWMSASGVIPVEEDYSAYLSACVICVGEVGAMPMAPAVVLTVLGALCLVWAVTEAVLVLTGVQKPAKKQKKEKPARETPAEETAPVTEETVPAEEERPEEEDTPVEGEAPVEEAPAEEEAPVEEEATAEEETDA